MMEAGQDFVTINETVGEDGKPDLSFRMDREKLEEVGVPAIKNFLTKLQVWQILFRFNYEVVRFQFPHGVNIKYVKTYLEILKWPLVSVVKMIKLKTLGFCRFVYVNRRLRVIKEIKIQDIPYPYQGGVLFHLDSKICYNVLGVQEVPPNFSRCVPHSTNEIGFPNWLVPDLQNQCWVLHRA